MDKPFQILQKIFIGLFTGLLAVMIYGYVQGADLSILWNVTTSAESEKVTVHRFQKGPFSFDLFGTSYELAENFSAGPIQSNPVKDAVFLGLIFLGICIILGISTYLSRVWFIGIAGLFIFFMINLRLQDIGLFGFSERSSVPVILILAGYLTPAYLFHSFYKNAGFLLRLGSLAGVSVLILLFCQVELVTLQTQLIAGSYFGLIIIALIFLLLIAEENVFGILYLITRSKGGKNNHIHFSIFSLIYLGFLAVYYAKKSALLKVELTYFDPYVLFVISSLVALWSLKYKQAVFENILSVEKLRILFSGLGIITFGFLGMAFFRGNDPIYEGLHYFIVYCHLGFGAMFFFYLLLNFINPLSKGLQVFKVAYKEQNFPYISAKLAGIAAVAGFFFLANKEPFLLFRAGHYNYLGAQAEQSGEAPLAQEYYREGSIYGYDNHFSNYKMGYYQLQKGDIDEASYRFGRATLRYPSPQSFINHASTLAMLGESTPSLVSLKNGLREFPNNNQLFNNLGLAYLDLGERQQALHFLNQSGSGDQWTNANQVNLWKVKPLDDTTTINADYQKGNLAVKGNIIHRQLKNGTRIKLPFDRAFLYPSYPLHRITYLINGAWYFRNQDLSQHLEKSLSGPIDENVYQSAKHAMSLSHYLQGRVNEALLAHDILRNESRSIFQQDYLHELGLMALEQHALPNALSFFEEAIAHGGQKSLLSKAATLLEMGEFEAALSWTESLVKADSAYGQLATDLKKIMKKGDLTLDEQLTRLYYFYEDYSLAEASVPLAKADPPYVFSLWQKIEAELLLEEAHEKLADYRDVFAPYLPRKAFREGELLMALANGRTVENDHVLSQALQAEADTVKARSLAEIANRNALNVPLFLATIHELNKLDENTAYDALVQAYNLNRHSPKIIKAYIDQCLQMNLTDYATAPLNRLSAFLPEDEYFRYVDTINQKIEAMEQESGW